MNNEKYGYYYGIDNDKYGTIQSVQKMLYPSSNGFMVNTKSKVGENYLTKQKLPYWRLYRTMDERLNSKSY